MERSRTNVEEKNRAEIIIASSFYFIKNPRRFFISLSLSLFLLFSLFFSVNLLDSTVAGERDPRGKINSGIFRFEARESSIINGFVGERECTMYAGAFEYSETSRPRIGPPLIA